MDVGTLIAGLLTLAILTFLYRDNPVYKMAESLLIGVSVGYMLVTTVSSALMGLLFKPLFIEGSLDLVVPFLLGLLMFGRFFAKTAFLSRLPIAVMIGSGAGVAIPAMLEQRTLKQLSATVMPLVTESGWPDVAAIMVLLGVITTLCYFYFSHEHKGPLGMAARVGTYFLMLFFGTTFGYTVMSRMSTFIGRMEFLLTDFVRLGG
ncbi:MAG: hypothetical protein OEV49_13405 [candidate division Zixibacteria bacterium]|nr:hypothetical protein [candidate division Zixibacteria bacterium]MDH3938346.1 hypothetical protein [candidate division Zixibacteria bacterium]